MSSSKMIKTPKAFRELLSKYKVAYVLSHKYADVDALASSVAFAYVLESKYKYDKAYLLCPEGVSASALNVASSMGISVTCIEGPQDLPFPPEEGSLLLLIDVGGSSQLGGLKNLLYTRVTKVLVDHHYRNDLVNSVDYVVMPPRAFSTSEITAVVFRKLIDDSRVAGLLLAGIIHDTSRFKRASALTFTAAGYLTRLISYGRTLYTLRNEEDFSKRLAKLKGLQRSIVTNAGELIIVVTYVGSFESDVAASLLLLGADVAVVVSSKEDETRVIVRGSGRISERQWEKISGILVEQLNPASFGGHLRASVLTIGRAYSKRDLPGLCKKIGDALSSGLSSLHSD